MMSDHKRVKLHKVPGDEDDTRTITVDGDVVPGQVFRGWLRLGGEQWVVQLPGRPAHGEPTLRDIKTWIARQIIRSVARVGTQMPALD